MSVHTLRKLESFKTGTTFYTRNFYLVFTEQILIYPSKIKKQTHQRYQPDMTNGKDMETFQI